jgi:hypothetical protein
VERNGEIQEGPVFHPKLGADTAREVKNWYDSMVNQKL